MTKISSYCFPNRDEVSRYKLIIENLNNEKLRLTLKLILVSGFRINEVLNSYLFKDENNQLYLRAPASKTKSMQVVSILKQKGHKGNYSAFLGRDFLLSIITSREKWKSVLTQNLFDLNLNELNFLVNDNLYEPNLFFGEYLADYADYNKLYLELKNSLILKVKFKPGKYEDYVTQEIPVSFHFFRKLFIAEFNAKNNYNIVKTIDYVKWSNMNMILEYVKNY